MRHLNSCEVIDGFICQQTNSDIGLVEAGRGAGGELEGGSSCQTDRHHIRKTKRNQEILFQDLVGGK